jgi:glutamate-1-semialdehyde 2,1-aminomutase
VTAEEQQLVRKAQQYMPGGSLGNLYNDVIIREGRGSRVWDVSGNEYVDYLLGSGPMLLGHSHPEVVAAVREQLERGTTFFATNEHAILLAEEIVKAVPCAEKLRFSSSGTEATLYAMRAARAYRKRDKILKFEGGFHGMNDYALMSMGPARPADFPTPVPDSAGIPRSVQGEMLIAPFNDIETASSIIQEHHDELAGVIVEPFQRLLPPRPGFLQGLREVTQHYEIPLIFDEIVTGFRFAYGGAQEYYGVTPDLCTLGKIAAGGYPLSAVAGRGDIMAHFDPAASASGEFMPQIGTLSGNPIAAVAGLATLKVLKRKGTYEKLFATGQQLKDALQRLMDEAEIPARVVGEAPLFEVYFTEHEIIDYRSTLRSDRKMLGRFNKLLLEQGVLKGDTKYYVSLAHTQEDVNHTIEAYASAIDELKG